MRVQTIQRIAVYLLLCGISVTGLFAQTARGTISGRVKDTTGAVVPAVSVTVTDQATGTKSTVQTQSDGAYIVPNLLPSTYNISVQAAGFKRLSIEGIRLEVGTIVT